MRCKKWKDLEIVKVHQGFMINVGSYSNALSEHNGNNRGDWLCLRVESGGPQGIAYHESTGGGSDIW